MKPVVEPIAAVVGVWATFALAAYALYSLRLGWLPTLATVSFISWGLAFWILRQHPQH